MTGSDAAAAGQSSPPRRRRRRWLRWCAYAALALRAHLARTVDDLRAELPWTVFTPLVVAGERANALRERLDAAFAAQRGSAVQSARYGMTFVPSQESYWFAHDCADVVAEWLVELDCRVSWLLVRLGFTVPATR